MPESTHVKYHIVGIHMSRLINYFDALKVFQEERSGSMEESLSARLEIEGRSRGTVFKQDTLSSAQYWFSPVSVMGLLKNVNWDAKHQLKKLTTIWISSSINPLWTGNP